MAYDPHEIVTINLRRRWVLTNRDELCEITNMFDASGDETDDLEQVSTAVARLDDNTWFTVDVNMFDPPKPAN